MVVAALPLLVVIPFATWPPWVWFLGAYLMSALISMEFKTGSSFAINDHLKQLFDLRRPKYALLEEFQELLKGDRFLFTQDRTMLLDSLQEIIAEQDDLDWNFW